jgi:hypothetical protein
MIITAPKTLDDKGRCCGRKPIVYKRPHHFYCDRCDAAFDPSDGKQVPNWAYYKLDETRFEARTTRAISPAGRKVEA